MEFETKIAGIPCVCRVIDWTPYREMKVTGSGMGDCDPPEYEEFEFEILDRKGYKASWLMAKLTAEDKDRLLEELHIEQTGERYGYL